MNVIFLYLIAYLCLFLQWYHDSQCFNITWHWKPPVAIMPTLLSPVLQVFITTTDNASDDKVGIMTSLGFQSIVYPVGSLCTITWLWDIHITHNTVQWRLYTTAIWCDELTDGAALVGYWQMSRFHLQRSHGEEMAAFLCVNDQLLLELLVFRQATRGHVVVHTSG